MSFDKTFTKLCYTREPSIVFDDFLNYVIDQFLINPNLNYFPKNNYSDKECELFFDLFKELVLAQDEKLKTNGWFDMIGHFYEDCVQSKMKAKNAGQFYTPMDVCNVMALTNVKNIDGDDVLDVNDCASGSGRLLLAHHVLRPRDICHAADLDITSCKMTLINFILHGVKGSVNHMNTLSMEWFNGWKVNETMDLGMPFTIMECNSEAESYCFIGHHKNFTKAHPYFSIESDEEEVVANNNIETTEKVKTGQMTLI